MPNSPNPLPVLKIQIPVKESSEIRKSAYESERKKEKLPPPITLNYDIPKTIKP